MAIKRLSVRSPVSANHCHKSSGYWLWSEPKGIYWLALSPPSGVTTIRCRFAPVGIELHSHPSRLVNTPGSLCCSAASIISCQASLEVLVVSPKIATPAILLLISATGSPPFSAADLGKKLAKKARPLSLSSAVFNCLTAHQRLTESYSPISSHSIVSPRIARITPSISA